MHVILRKNINDRFPELTSSLNIRICSNSPITISIVYPCKASYGNPNTVPNYNLLSNLNIIFSNHNLDNNTDCKTLTKMTDEFHDTNLSKTTTLKKLSAIPFFGINTDRTTKIFTYLERAKFFLSNECVNIIFQPNMCVKSRQNHCENTSKCVHVHHFGFVLVTSAYGRASPRTLGQLNFTPRSNGQNVTVAHPEEPRSAMFTNRENKHIHKVSRLENKVHETLLNRTKMQVFTQINGKNTSNTIYIHSTQHRDPSLTGIDGKIHSKKPKHQPFKCTFKTDKIIMIIDHQTRCRHIHDPPYKLWLL